MPQATQVSRAKGISPRRFRAIGTRGWIQSVSNLAPFDHFGLFFRISFPLSGGCLWFEHNSALPGRPTIRRPHYSLTNMRLVLSPSRSNAVLRFPPWEFAAYWDQLRFRASSEFWPCGWLFSLRSIENAFLLVARSSTGLQETKNQINKALGGDLAATKWWIVDTFSWAGWSVFYRFVLLGSAPYQWRSGRFDISSRNSKSIVQLASPTAGNRLRISLVILHRIVVHTYLTRPHPLRHPQRWSKLCRKSLLNTEFNRVPNVAACSCFHRGPPRQKV